MYRHELDAMPDPQEAHWRRVSQDHASSERIALTTGRSIHVRSAQIPRLRQSPSHIFTRTHPILHLRPRLERPLTLRQTRHDESQNRHRGGSVHITGQTRMEGSRRYDGHSGVDRSGPRGRTAAPGREKLCCWYKRHERGHGCESGRIRYAEWRGCKGEQGGPHGRSPFDRQRPPHPVSNVSSQLPEHDSSLAMLARLTKKIACVALALT